MRQTVVRNAGQHEPHQIVGDLLHAEISEKQARSIKYQMTIAKLPLAKEIDEFDFGATPVNETLVRAPDDRRRRCTVPPATGRCRYHRCGAWLFRRPVRSHAGCQDHLHRQHRKCRGALEIGALGRTACGPVADPMAASCRLPRSGAWTNIYWSGAVIFLTVGTQLPFDRLTSALDAWCAVNPQAQVFGQVGDLGRDNCRPKHFEWVERMTPDNHADACDRADLIVGHTGTGTILAGLMRSTPLILLPRRAALREHRNDHQLATAAHLATRTGIQVVHEVSALHTALDRYRLGGMAKSERLGDAAEPTLTDALRAFILEGEQLGTH
jgi:UDP-N-acetylglucosamine transferase subunit ALG13